MILIAFDADAEAAGFCYIEATDFAKGCGPWTR
mgnify:CR=1 FL=1